MSLDIVSRTPGFLGGFISTYQSDAPGWHSDERVERRLREDVPANHCPDFLCHPEKPMDAWKAPAEQRFRSQVYPGSYASRYRVWRSNPGGMLALCSTMRRWIWQIYFVESKLTGDEILVVMNPLFGSALFEIREGRAFKRGAAMARWQWMMGGTSTSRFVRRFSAFGEGMGCAHRWDGIARLVNTNGDFHLEGASSFRTAGAQQRNESVLTQKCNYSSAQHLDG